ncbi:MAG TPA: UTP--glucose-1-phosphate uridylyltransferase [Acidimicrobiales bacterium]
MLVRKAVIPAAGLGTRFLPATKALPKEMLPLVDRPAIQWVVEEAVRAGITDILLVVGRTKKSIEDHFDRAPELEAFLARAGKDAQVEQLRAVAELADVHFVRQGEPLGLGHAVGLARHHVGDEPFAVLLPDDVMAADAALLPDMLAAHDRAGGCVVALKRFPPEELSAYGVVSTDGGPDDRGVVAVTGTVEKPPANEAPSDLAIMGRYVLVPEVFAAIDRLEPGAGGELQLTDALRMLVGQVPFHGVVFEGGRYDTGSKLDWLRATVELSLRDPELGSSFREALADIVRREGIR